MADKYPEFYVKKRQREELYRRTVQIIVGVAVLLICGGIGGFFIYKYVLQPVREPAPAPQQLADERQQLATENALASTSGQRQSDAAAASRDAGAEPLVADLGDIPYDPSFPGVHVGVEGSDTSVALEGETEGDEEASAEAESGSEAETGESAGPPSGREQSDSFDRPSDAAPSSNSDGEKQQKNDKPAGEAGTSKPETKPPAESAEEEQQATPPADTGGSGKTIFHVYAGSYATREEAESIKNDLQALGFQGQIIDAEIEFHVRVASMEDFEYAKAIRQKLIDSGFPKAFATRNRS